MNLVPHEELMNKTMDMAGRFAKGPSLSYRFTKWSIYEGLNIDLQGALENEVIGQSQLVRSEDVKIAVKAFLEKKTPIFKGK